MAAYSKMTLPAGSRVAVYSPGDPAHPIAGGALLEDFTISLSSQFDQLVDSGNNDAFTAIGGAMKRFGVGFSSSFKQMGFQIWKGTEPVSMTFSLEFHYTYNAYAEVVEPIKKLAELPLPGEGVLGNLIPPGPSVIDAIMGPSEANTAPTGAAPEVPADTARSRQTADSYVNITVGGMKFLGCIVTNVEPTFSKFVDTNNNPIFGRVSITFKTMYTATKTIVRNL